MSEKPILFSTDMVKAILGGHKTQTRRVIRRQIDMEFDENDPYFGPYWLYSDVPGGEKVISPYGQPGDTLWVRETWNQENSEGCSPRDLTPHAFPVVYKADDEDFPWWRPSIFMPRWASRINLLVKDIRVEQVKDISNDDAVSEGIDDSRTSPHCQPKDLFAELWDSINAKRGYGWDVNPWVWVVKFEVMK